uniref:Uncharacterized protein n=1 Tax=Chenopodium quinoa TaxID=63459 RepID=A0A803MQF0_CHEQI
MEVGEELSTMATISKSTAVTACVAMTLLYVAILYAPTLIFRLPPPTSYQQFMIRRFVVPLEKSFVPLWGSMLLKLFSGHGVGDAKLNLFLILTVKSWKITYVLNLYGIQADNVVSISGWLWHAVIFPLSLTSLVYAGSLVLKCLLLLDSWIEDGSEGITLNCLHNLLHKIYCGFISVASNIGAWRNLVVVSFFTLFSVLFLDPEQLAVVNFFKTSCALCRF